MRFIPGAGLAILGSVIALAGVGLLAAFGTDGRLDSGPHRLATPSAAIVSSVASIKNTSGVTSLLGQPRLRVAASPVHGGAATFVGIGRTADVDRYLAGVSTDEVTGLTVYPYSINSALHNGRADAPRPATQHFWVAQASSTRAAVINWKIRDGRYRVVIMSADGRGGSAASSGIRRDHAPHGALRSRGTAPGIAHRCRGHRPAHPRHRPVPRPAVHHNRSGNEHGRGPDALAPLKTSG